MRVTISDGPRPALEKSNLTKQSLQLYIYCQNNVGSIVHDEKSRVN